MDNNDKIMYIRFVGFSEDANKAINKAIFFSENFNCENVNSVHTFMGLILNSKIGENILNKHNITFEEIYNVYKDIAEQGKYGFFDSSNVQFSLQYLSREVAELIGEATRIALMDRYVEITADDLLKSLIELNSSQLEEFIEMIGLTKESIKNTYSSVFDIPEILKDQVKYLNEYVKNNEQTITNVEKYTDELIEILCRKVKANPCLIGEAGVGKTTVVYKLVQLINKGNVPDNLKDTHIVELNGALLTSGTRFRGDFEEKMQVLIEWASEQNVILFFDEFHTFIGAGGGSRTAGNMIKSALSDGSIKIIGATTIKEYHKYIERDSAFIRRIQTLNIKEPSVEESITIINNTINDYEVFHGVSINEDTLRLAVELSDKYIRTSCLPDKAYTVLDQAFAKVKISNRIKVLDSDILHIISKLSGVNVNKLNKKESNRILQLDKIIAKDLIGQKQAINTVCKAIRRAKSGVSDTNKPLASFLFVGPTGVGKTELCKILSKEIAHGETPLIKIDMSEYSEKYSISKLIGSAPGYIGYQEGGQLTEKVKHNPYSIVLFDEIEKAHPEVFNTFLQLLDEGRLTDSEGETIDFKNCIIVMTSNAGYGAEGFSKGTLGFASDKKEISNKDKEIKALKALEETFKPEFLNRIDNIVIFNPLNMDECRQITKLMLNKLSSRLKKTKNINVMFTDSLVNKVTESGFSDKYGARNIRREIQDTIEDILSEAILTEQAVNGSTITLGVKNKNISITSIKNIIHDTNKVKKKLEDTVEISG